MAFNLGETVLHDLQADDQTNLLDAIDELRGQGISKDIDLPQLIVCGDQSSGKSSLLEAITHLPFPTKDGICTTFATEVALRRAPSNKVNITITPGDSRNEGEKQRLKEFRVTFTNPADFPGVVDEAKRCMNPSSIVQEKSINDDVLHLEITGPDCPPLTIVDLPGLIQSEGRYQSEEDITTVKELVDKYMKNKRSIILAVIAANYDFANQGILRMAKSVDPQGVRTLGIITKPDRIPVGSGDERAAISLANNQEHHLQLGWHVIRNRDFNSMDSTSEERDAAEESFFSTGVWRSFPRSQKGIGALRLRLCDVLLQQIRKELPVLVEEIDKGLTECQDKLRRLGKPRETAREQRLYLADMAKSFERLALDAINGAYENPFFDNPNEDDRNKRRLRAVIQNLNERFAKVMATHGHKQEIIEDGTEYLEGLPLDREISAPEPELILRSDYIHKITEMVHNSRGRELAGTFNPLLVGDLFRQQSYPWTDLAKGHVDRVSKAADYALEAILRDLTDDKTFMTLLFDHIKPALEKRREKLHAKLEELLKPYRRGHLITYHPSFVKIIQRQRADRRKKSMFGKLSSQIGPLEDWKKNPSRVVGLNQVIQVISSSEEDESADEYASSELLSCMEAYYKIALNVFVDNVGSLAVEDCLMDGLDEIFSQSAVMEMDDETLASLAAESEQIKTERCDLEAMLKSLKQGALIVNKHAKQAEVKP